MGKVASLSTAIRQECLKHSRKAARISIQTAHTLSNAKGTGTELDVKELLTQQVDSIALLGRISHELACVRRYKIKSVLKPEFAPICADTGQSSTFLFGDDLQKQLKGAKGSSSFGQVVIMTMDVTGKVGPPMKRHQDQIFTDEEGRILARKARGNLNRRNNKPTSKY